VAQSNRNLFGILTARAIRRGIFDSCEEQVAKIMSFIDPTVKTRGRLPGLIVGSLIGKLICATEH
jgi:hypothetical protein